MRRIGQSRRKFVLHPNSPAVAYEAETLVKLRRMRQG